MLQHAARAGDLAARLGGDEFALLINGGQDVAVTAAARIRSGVEERMSARGWAVTASVGAAGFSVAPDDAEAVIAAADAAMYAAKKAGRPSWP